MKVISLKLILLMAVSSSAVSCQQQATSEQALEQLNKQAAREVTLKTEVKGDSVLHITTQQIWFHGEQVASKNDTIVTAASPQNWSASTDSTQSLKNVPIYVTVQ